MLDKCRETSPVNSVCSIKEQQAIILAYCGPETDLPSSLQVSFMQGLEGQADRRPLSPCLAWLLEHDFSSFSYHISLVFLGLEALASAQ